MITMTYWNIKWSVEWLHRFTSVWSRQDHDRIITHVLHYTFITANTLAALALERNSFRHWTVWTLRFPAPTTSLFHFLHQLSTVNIHRTLTAFNTGILLFKKRILYLYLTYKNKIVQLHNSYWNTSFEKELFLNILYLYLTL